MYSGNVSPCIEVNLTRDFKGEKTPLHVIIYKTYVVVTPLSIEPLPDAEPDLDSITRPAASTVKLSAANPSAPKRGGYKATTKLNNRVMMIF